MADTVTGGTGRVVAFGQTCQLAAARENQMAAPTLRGMAVHEEDLTLARTYLSVPDRGWRWRLLGAVAAAVTTAVVAVPSAASAANNSGINTSSANGLVVRDFDAVTTVSQNNVWKHLALIQDRYVIYNDFGIIEGPGRIREKWPFLPAEFVSDLDDASVEFSGPGFRWRYTFTKGTSAVVFEDSGIVFGPFQMVQDYDGLASFNNPFGFAPVNYFAVRGSQFVMFNSLPGPAVTTELGSIPGILGEFTHDLDDVSVELQNGTLKYSFYRDNLRLIVQNGRAVELADLTQKWPFLINFRLP